MKLRSKTSEGELPFTCHVTGIIIMSGILRAGALINKHYFYKDATM